MLVTSLEGNMSHLEGRINNQILGVKGLRFLSCSWNPNDLEAFIKCGACFIFHIGLVVKLLKKEVGQMLLQMLT